MNIPNWFSSLLQGYFFVGSLYIWCAIEVINTLILGRRRTGGQRKDRGSFLAVLITIYFAISLEFVIRGMKLGLLPGVFQWAGLALVWMGVLVRQSAIFSLGRAFTAVVAVSPDQHLVTSGLFRWIRHPSYSGGIITISGFGLAAGTWLGAILALTIVLLGYSYRVNVEEQAMLEAFGDEYREYMRRTGRFFPRVM